MVVNSDDKLCRYVQTKRSAARLLAARACLRVCTPYSYWRPVKLLGACRRKHRKESVRGKCMLKRKPGFACDQKRDLHYPAWPGAARASNIRRKNQGAPGSARKPPGIFQQITPMSQHLNSYLLGSLPSSVTSSLCSARHPSRHPFKDCCLGPV